MNLSIAIALLAAVFAWARSENPVPVASDRPRDIAGGTFVLPERDFRREFLVPYCERLLLRYRDVPLIVAWMFASEEQRDEFFVTLRPTYYPAWRRLYDVQSKQQWTAALFLAIRGSGILRIRTRDGKVESLEIGGGGPGRRILADPSCRVLYLSFAEEPLPTRRRHVTFYIQTRDPITEATGLRLQAEMPDLPFAYTFLQFRADPWFISELGFPIFDLFQPGLVPPNHREYCNSPLMGCGGDQGKPSCSMFQHSCPEPENTTEPSRVPQ